MSVKTLWKNALVVQPDGVRAVEMLVDENGQIADFAPRGTAAPESALEVDLQGKILFPGLIDLLQHGFENHLYSEPQEGMIADASFALLKRGVTGWLPSIPCMPPEQLPRVLAALSAQIGQEAGAVCLGIHSEGPCFNSPGAHNPRNLQLPSLALAENLMEAAQGKLKAITLAPELPEAKTFIQRLKSNGVSIHLGHSRAEPEDVPEYVSWGIDAVTHMFNVMRLRDIVENGCQRFSLPDALMAEPSLALGLICDGIHVPEGLVRLLAQLPEDRVFLETDANKNAGNPAREFEFYPGYLVRSAPGEAVREVKGGGLAGSSLTSDEAMRNFMALARVDLRRAAQAAALVPARVIGMDDQIGSLVKGKRADFAVLSAQDLTVQATAVGGKLLWSSL